MAKLSPPDPAGLICGILAADDAALALGRESLIQAFGQIVVESEPIPFTFTAYYDREMGAGLVKQFVGFGQLVQKDRIAEIKLDTNRMESELGAHTPQGLKRSVNLDPGYLTLAKVVLATTKNRDHRIYLGKGVFAEITLRYAHGRYEPQPWTYPDCQSEQATRFFLAMREYVHRTLTRQG